jgi:hypothetical protein
MGQASGGIFPLNWGDYFLEPVSKISSAPVDEMRAATSLNFAKKSSVYLSGYTSGFFARFPRLASHLFNLATKLFLRPVLNTTLSVRVLIDSVILPISIVKAVRLARDTRALWTRLSRCPNW